MTGDLQSLNLLAKLMVLHCQILFSLAISAIAEAILMWTSAEHVPSLHRLLPGTGTWSPPLTPGCSQQLSGLKTLTY